MFDPISSLAALPISLGLHLHSIHFPDRGYENNSNPGIYISTKDFVLGIYKNSLSNTSVYAGVQTLPEFHILGIKPELYVGLISGYQPTLVHYTNSQGVKINEYRDGPSIFIAPSFRFPIADSFYGRISIFGRAVNASIEYKFN